MKEDIIRMAQEAGWPEANAAISKQRLERFAALVADAEREVCAKLIESHKTGANELMDAVRDMEARAIRARGQA
jgi:hypothetical protein